MRTFYETGLLGWRVIFAASFSVTLTVINILKSSQVSKEFGKVDLYHAFLKNLFFIKLIYLMSKLKNRYVKFPRKTKLNK